ncbi:hypothetical protein KC363_g2747 [Hortaea werneckii]|uniref:tRNA(Phe) 7-[(3-amino-3-carboxypropyl)-4-demethylwyosine(37)-N(4)]-methyltransferase n=1 Tax=Hortaea werneckii TaxID=91943 RepID=A0A3M7FY26_HORWE|nr:hypothetical protein KC363_g2747 [Hortaea werneckii]RMY93779.1 hypothetical protein D0861_01721 [Hortaea werneckii]
MPATFRDRKAKILQDLSIPDDQYEDLSPKGSVDEGIKELISEINGLPDYVTTSSCAGRVAVYLEGAKGAKGGGRWLFTSHDLLEPPIKDGESGLIALFGLSDEAPSAPLEAEGVRFVHFKSEPMILHILTSSLASAHHAASAALQAGFRESGINSTQEAKDGSPACPMVAVRSSGLAFDCIIGYYAEGSSPEDQGTIKPMVSEGYLRTLVNVANQRFRTNIERRERFRATLLKDVRSSTVK